jgi:hypothetical protein
VRDICNAVQLNAELQSNKTEKAHKDTLKRFFVAVGFVNLDKLNEQRISPASAGHSSRAPGGEMGTTIGDDEIQWPNLYDIVID